MAKIFECENDRGYVAAIGNAGDDVILAEFYAEWTTPSQIISHEIEILRQSFPDLYHLRVNFDTCPVIFYLGSISKI